MTIKRIYVAASILAVTAVGVGLPIASCSQAVPNATTPTMQRAQKVDVVCMQVNDTSGNALAAPTPVPEELCVPVPPNGNGAAMPYHLYALVTQSTLGEVAVVDLTAGVVVDVDRSNPGVDFIPIGANPTDVAVSPDARFTFVSSADPNKMALYAFSNARLLGNSTGTAPPAPIRLPDLAGCVLSQRPQALEVVPTSATDGGAASSSYVLIALLAPNGGMPAAVVTLDPMAVASAPPGSLPSCGDIHAVVAATALSAALPASWKRGPAWADGVPYADAGVQTAVPSCSSVAAGPSRPDAAGGADGDNAGDAAMDGADGVDAGALAVDGVDADAGALAADGAEGVDAGDAEATGGDGTPQVVATPTQPAGLPRATAHPRALALRRDVPVLYIADESLPAIHVVDLRDPASPVELEPLLATSVEEPGRQVSVGAIAVSPTTRDYKTYLYAVDSLQGTLMVYDITDPRSPQRTPLERPHPELNPLAPLDRLAFSAPVAAVAFAEHDWPLPSQVDPLRQYTGLLCNPNPNAHPDSGAFVDLGAYYRADRVGSLIQVTDTLGGTVQSLPTRLRGIFGFATLSNGNVVTIDVDDWDAPCRRPDPMALGIVADPLDTSKGAAAYAGGQTGVLDVPEPSPTGPDDVSPYHAPVTYSNVIPESAAVTLEAFFPVSAPHRTRSNALLRNDPTNGVHIPNLLGVPQLFNATGAPVATSGPGGVVNPLLLPAPMPAGFIDPSYEANPTEPNPNSRGIASPGLANASAAGSPIPEPLFPGSSSERCGADAGIGCTATSAPGVRLSFDDPTAHQDQDWTVTYEGALPTVGGIAATIESTLPASDPVASYQTLTLSAPGASFCSRGVEDWSVGQMRAGRLLSELAREGLPAPPVFPVQGPTAPTLPQWTADYVEIADDVLADTDPYWTEPSSVNDCWDGALADAPGFAGSSSPRAEDRYNFCQQTYGAAADADTNLARDFPILHARDDSLEVGRFGWYPTNAAGTDAGATAGVPVPELTTNRLVVPADPGNRSFLRLARCCFHHQAAFKVRTGGEWVAVGSGVNGAAGVGLLHQVVRDASGACVLSCDPNHALMNARSFDIPWSTWSNDAKSCTPAPRPSFDRDSPLAMRNPMFSFVLWSGCGLPAGYPAGSDHTLATRDLSWKFSVRGGFTPLTVSVVSPTNGTGVSPQSMRFIRSLGQLAVVDGESQGLVLVDLNLVAVAHSYF